MTLSALSALLSDAGIPDPGCEARLLFSHFSGIPQTGLFGCDPDCDAPGLSEAVRRRLTREPLAYILGTAPFFRQEYEVGQGCLIPRADTERLVEIAIRNLPPNARFCDLCTGCGTIALTVLCERRDTVAVATDISGSALFYAKKNAEKYRLTDRLTLLCADLFSEEPPGIFDAILANPPYIRTPVLKTLSPEVQKEPGSALDGGEDGLDFYRRILSFAPHLSENGFFLFECGYDQKTDMTSLAAQHGLSAEPFFDYGKNFRGVLLRK